MASAHQQRTTMRGFTLLQLLLTMALVAILLSASLPSFSALVDRTRIRTVTRSYVTAIETARHAAITRGMTVTLCRSRDGATCSGSWEEGLIVFTDANANRVADDDDTLLWRGEPIGGYTVSWRSFQNRQYLRFSAQGMMLYQNGNFLFCPQNADTRHALTLIVNAMGRVREGIDSNGNGIVENSSGEDVSCP